MVRVRTTRNGKVISSRTVRGKKRSVPRNKISYGTIPSGVQVASGLMYAASARRIHTLTMPGGTLQTHATAPTVDTGSLCWLKVNDLFSPVGTTGAPGGSPLTGTSAAQPMGFDQLALLYGRYRVYKVEIEVVFDNVTTTSGAAQICGLIASGSEFTPSSTAIEDNGQCEFVPVSPEQTRTLSMTLDVAKYLQVSNRDDSISATSAGSPTRKLYVGIFSHNMGVTAIGGTGPHLCTYQVRVKYHTEWSDRKMITVS